MLSIFAICIGASAGALARWALALWLNPAGGSAPLWLPWGTLAANWLGGYGVGVAVGTFQAMPALDPVWRLALITGFLGALTTFSTFSVEVVAMLQSGRYAMALATSAVHLLGSLGLTVAGLQTVKWWMAA